MLYFKNVELAQKYHVSLGTVRNWIEASQGGKLDLVLQEHDGKIYVANTGTNISIIERLAESGKKYRNTRAVKVVSPRPEFYKLYTRRQIREIMSDLEIHHEIAHKYDFMGGGAQHFDDYAKRQAEEKASNVLKATIDLIRDNLPAIDNIIKGHERVNVIDLGPGNARPARELLKHLLDKGVLGRYIAVDISKKMLDIAENNVNDWFGGRVKFEGHVKDLDFERFDDLLVDDMVGKMADRTVNLVLIFGGTPKNFPSFADPARIAYGSMGARDALLYTGRSDNENSRRYFDFSGQPGVANISPYVRFVADMLGIEHSYFEPEMGYDEYRGMRYVRVRLKTALKIKFKFKEGESMVYLDKGTAILLLRIWHFTTLEMISEFEKLGLELLQASTTSDRDYLLTIFGVDAKRLGK